MQAFSQAVSLLPRYVKAGIWKINNKAIFAAIMCKRQPGDNNKRISAGFTAYSR